MALQFSGPGALVSEAAASRLDAVAEITARPEPDWRALREAYEKDDGLRVPPVVKTFGPGGPKEVAVSV